MNKKKNLYLILLFNFIIQLEAGCPFNLKNLYKVENFECKDYEYIKSNDKINLAYYKFIPKKPIAIIIFYHGAGFYSSKLYQYFAKQLLDLNIGCVLFDIRGHGNSEGKRGDAPSEKEIFNDITIAVANFKKIYKDIPIYLGGHSSGAGLIINYNEKINNKEVRGYLFIAPYLGANANCLKKNINKENEFVKSINFFVLIGNILTAGYFFKHDPFIFFNYSFMKDDLKIVNNYTLTMSNATSPKNAESLFKKINKPIGLFIGNEDELFDFYKVLNYKKYLSDEVLKNSKFKVIDNATHLNILLSISNEIYDFIKSDLLII